MQWVTRGVYDVKFFDDWCMSRPGLTIGQNKHMHRASSARGTTKIWSQGNLFHQPDIRLITHQKSRKNVGKMK